MKSFSIQASSVGIVPLGAALSVGVNMTRDQQEKAVIAILGTFTAEDAVAFLVAEFGELVQEKAE